MRNLLLIMLAVGVVAAFSAPVQETKGNLRQRPPAAPSNADSSPLTLVEMAAVMQQVETAVQTVVLRNYKPVARTKYGEGTAKTPLIVSEFGRLFSLSKPRFKITPTPLPVNQKVLSIKSGDPARPKLEALIKWGFVGRVSPLATSPKLTLTPEQFGDAVGLFLARMAELTHTPDSRWSPYMNWHQEEQGGTVPPPKEKRSGGN